VLDHVVALRVSLVGVELVPDCANQRVDLVDELRLGFHGNNLAIGAVVRI